MRLLYIALTFFLVFEAVYAATPTAAPDFRIVPLNHPITINVLENDSDQDGGQLNVSNQLSTSPSYGTAHVNPDGGIRYQPDQDFVGTDTFSYILEDAQGETAIGDVTIRVSQHVFQEAASNTNIKRVGGALDEACQASVSNDQTRRSIGAQGLAAACSWLLSAANHQELEQMLASIAPEETLALLRSAVSSNESQLSALNSRISKIGSSSSHLLVNGRPVLKAGLKGGSAGIGDLLSRVNIFSSIMLDDTNKTASDLEAGFRSDGEGVTLGADYAYSQHLHIGSAIAWSKNKILYRSNGGRMDSSLTNLFGFVTYQKNNYSVDLQLGLGTANYDMYRSIQLFNPVNEDYVLLESYGKTSGTQLQVNSQFQYDYHYKSLSIYPLLGLHYSRNSVEEYGEVSSSGLDISLGRQQLDNFQVRFGVQGQYVMNRSWGVLLPAFELMGVSRLSARQIDVQGKFAFAEEGVGEFEFDAEKNDSLYYRVNLGAHIILPRGVSGFIQYQQLLHHTKLRSVQYQMGMRYEY